MNHKTHKNCFKLSIQMIHADMKGFEFDKVIVSYQSLIGPVVIDVELDRGNHISIPRNFDPVGLELFDGRTDF